MVYVWTGLAQALGLKYYGIPGIHIPANTGFQYREPPENDAFMRADEYDQLIEDPTGFLLNVWLPRVSTRIVRPGQPASQESNLALIKGGMAMMKYFDAFGPQDARLRSESGTVSAIAGIFKAPMDIIADKLRGYLGLVEDLFERRDKVVAACEALMPHLYTRCPDDGRPKRLVPIGYWMHRGGVPFVSPEMFQNIYWATVKPIIEELWADGRQTLFYAEGKWDHHLESFAELPEQSIVYHVDQGDIFKAHRVLGEKFCLSGGIPNYLLGMRHARRGAAVLQEGHRRRGPRRRLHYGRRRHRPERRPRGEHPRHDRLHAGVRRLFVWQFARGDPAAAGARAARGGRSCRRSCKAAAALGRGVCVPWEQKRKDIAAIPGDEALVQRIWEEIEGLANMFIWQIPSLFDRQSHE